MNCPTCRSRSRVVDTRTRVSYVYRRRTCNNGHTFTTHELIVNGSGHGDNNAALLLRSLVAEMERAIARLECREDDILAEQVMSVE